MAVYHKECYQRKYGENWGCPINHCPVELPLICDECQKEINSPLIWTNSCH